jgi:phosphoglycolate phosphatase
LTTSIPAPSAIIFDWDNTLVDNWPAITHALNAALTAFGHAEVTEEDTRRQVRHSMRESFPKVFGDSWPEARRIFYEAFDSHHLEPLQPLDGAEDALRLFHNAGIYLALVSNKRGDYLRKEAEYLGWTRYFSRLIGAGDAEEDKPALAPVLLALDKFGGPRDEHVWFVGDAAVDMECGIKAGCTPVLRASGDEPADAFKDWPPLATVQSSKALVDLVQAAT